MRKILIILGLPIIFNVVFAIIGFMLQEVAPNLAWFLMIGNEYQESLNWWQMGLINIITHITTYSIVGRIFSFFGNWDKGLMKGLYFLLSETISILLAIALRYILDYWWVFLIIPSLIVVIAVIIFIKNVVIRENQVQ